MGSWLLELERTLRDECEATVRGAAAAPPRHAQLPPERDNPPLEHQRSPTFSCLTKETAAEILAGLALRQRLHANHLLNLRTRSRSNVNASSLTGALGP